MSPVTPGVSTTTSSNRARDDAPDPRAVPSLAPPAPGPAPADDDLPADGRSTRWADHREARRAELVRVARRTVHHRGPDVSMEEIAAAAGTSKSIVYRYFVDKTGLQIAVAELVVRQIRDALEDVLRHVSTPREASRAMVAVYLEMIEASPHVYAFVTRDGSVESGGPLGHFLDAVTALVAAPFARALTEERPADGCPAAPGTTASAAALAGTWAAGAVGFVRGAGEWWLAHRDEPGTPDRAALTAQVAAWLWAGPVGLLAREHRTPSTTSTPTTSTPTTTTAPAHPADRQPTGGDEAARTSWEQR
ncbi:TetR/AcrR family transcriptional regulator [Cellulomonas xiejunii]|uniref:TetR/AcrR family transcriptional regulator n=1 Tax=Cellulomonas xiejunii TaxID=2968083 RepID=UPI0035565A6B